MSNPLPLAIYLTGSNMPWPLLGSENCPNIFKKNILIVYVHWHFLISLASLWELDILVLVDTLSLMTWFYLSLDCSKW